jgi:SRSO17 transposase
MAERFLEHVKNYSHHFQSYRHDVSDGARKYASGLMQGGARKNMDRIAEVVPESTSRNLQQFITHSKWEWRAVMDQVASDVDELFGDPQEACLLIDESSFKKQGKKSVGVSRQWLGRLGKVDNGQVGVFGALANGERVCAIDARLYLPEEWTDDPERCESAGIPEEERVFRTKDELALEIVKHAGELGLRYGWVGADAGYGKGYGFMYALDDQGEKFLIDVHSDFRVYTEEPKPKLPTRKTGKGRRPKILRSEQTPLEVRTLVEGLSEDEWHKEVLRETTRGPLTLWAATKRVYVWNGKESRGREYVLVATKNVDGSDLKLSLTNMVGEGRYNLCHKQRQRYWVERTFEDGKSECGMADYQLRKWSGWHHHMALVFMSMAFMADERLRQKKELPLLSCSDIEELLSRFLPRRDTTKEEVIRQMHQRHKYRKQAIKSHRRSSLRKNKKGKIPPKPSESVK